MKKKDQVVDEKVLPKWINVKWLNWFVKKRLYIFFVLALFILISIVAYQLIPFFEKRGQKDFMTADLAYSKWKKEPLLNEHLEELKKLMNKYPSLKQKYEGLIAQGLILSSHFDEAMHFASISIKKASQLLPHYASYSNTSLLIAKKNYSQALANSHRLKKEMMLDPSFLQNDSDRTSILFALNLLRISLLEKKMRNDPAELTAWCEVENYLKLNSRQKLQVTEKELYSFLELFQSNKQLQLADYINHRKSQIR